MVCMCFALEKISLLQESNESRIITVQSSSDGTEGTQEDSQLAHPSDSQDSGYTMQNGDRDGERDSLNTIRSFDSAVQSMHNDKIEDNNISSTNGTTSHGTISVS